MASLHILSLVMNTCIEDLDACVEDKVFVIVVEGKRWVMIVGKDWRGVESNDLMDGMRGL